MQKWVEDFLVHLENKNFSAHTIRGYRADLNDFLLFCKQRTDGIPFRRIAFG